MKMISVLARQLSPSFLRPCALPSIRTLIVNATPPFSFMHFRSLSDDSDRPAPPNPAAWADIRMYSQKPSARQDEHLTIDQRWQRQSEKVLERGTTPAYAYTGRSVFVRDGFAKAYRSLSQRLIANNVKREFKAQQRHEKKGVKRRRLRSERWRRLFASEVRRKVQLVNEIRRRGA